MKNDRSIVLCFYFEENISQTSLLTFFLNYFNSKFNYIFSELNYTITDKSKTNWTQQNKGGKFSAKVVEKFIEVDKMGNDKIFIDFELLKNNSICEFKSRDIDVSISTDNDTDIKCLKLILNLTWIELLDIKEFVIDIVSFFVNNNVKIIYGVVFSMENIKLPSLFIEGIKSEELNFEETKIIDNRSQFLKSSKNKIWEIFWGNILTNNHLTEKNISDVKNIVGEDNFDRLNDEIYWFNTDEKLLSFKFEVKSNLRQKLITLFKRENIFFN